MSRYRIVYRCVKCGKIYRRPIHDCCGNCGCRKPCESISAQPKLFGLRGWNINSEGLPTKKFRIHYKTDFGGGYMEGAGYTEDEAIEKFYELYPPDCRPTITRVEEK